MNAGCRSRISAAPRFLAAKKSGLSDAQLKPLLEFQRKSQWRLDFASSENSMGFHAPQECARILAEAIDYARQGELTAMRIASGIAPPMSAPQATAAPATKATGTAVRK